MSKRGYKLQEFVAHSGNVNCLRIGKKTCRVFVTGGDDQNVNLWSVGKPTPLTSTVQLGLDFLSPESLGESVKLAEEIRGLPNDHDLKLQMLEVGKISLYAASSAGKEAQKLVLDPKLGAELGFEDPNLTAMVSENLEKMIKRRQIACA